MMDIKLIEMLHKNISDEAAYHLVKFIAELSIELENHYFSQLRRYEQEKNLRMWG